MLYTDLSTLSTWIIFKKETKMTNPAKISAINAKKASILFMGISHTQRNDALQNIAKLLEQEKNNIFKANLKDIEAAKEADLARPLIKRLLFDENKLNDVISGINNLKNLPDPIGKTTYASVLEEGLELYRVSCPIGVIGVIFESRPDALVQISTLCLKSGNAVILKGGFEANGTNGILAEIISKASLEAGIPEGWISLLLTRTDVRELLEMDGEVDLLIPRGSNSFVKMIMDNTKIPVLGHADGVCHTYIDEYAQADKALKIVLDAKMQYPSACNATETILIHKNIAGKILPLINDLFAKEGIEISGCVKTKEIISCNEVLDWHNEYLDLKVSVKIVEDTDAAISHINRYGSGHTEAIITENDENAKKFMAFCDSGNVFKNCSTRFSDGFRYGFGAEVGISTSKIHARGPVGLEGLVTYKYKLFGSGQTVSEFSSGEKSFVHGKTDKTSPFDR